MWSDLLPDKNTFQLEQLRCFLQRGFPSRREERWKYLDVSSLIEKKFRRAKQVDEKTLSIIREKKRKQYPSHLFLVFVNGIFSSALSDNKSLPKGLNFSVKSPSKQEWDVKSYPFAVLNTALMNEEISIQIEKNIKVAMPIHLLFLQTEDEQYINCPRYSVCVGKNSDVNLIEEHLAFQAKDYFTNSVVTINASAQSKVTYCKIQQEDVSATHIANIHINQARDSNITCFNFSVGGRIARDDVNVFQKEPGSKCELYGFYKLMQKDQQIDHHVYVNHIASHGVSKMLYKGILDKKSRAIFNGKVQIEKGAEKINAYQANHNLLLSSEAEVNSKPELEIYADDVKCAHGSTVGQLDQERLFYLRSRGIDKQTAITLLLRAFAEEVLVQLNCKELTQAIRGLL